MRDIRRIALKTAASAVLGLEGEYLYLKSLRAAERNAYRRRLRESHIQKESEFEGAKAANAKIALMNFAIAVSQSGIFGNLSTIEVEKPFRYESSDFKRYIRDDDALRQLSEFIYRDGSLGYCSKELFDRVCQLTVQEQVKLLCGWLTGREKLQRTDETVDGWLSRIGMGLNAWEGRWSQAKEVERAKWFPSKDRLLAIESERFSTSKSWHLFVSTLSALGIPLQDAYDLLRKIRDDIDWLAGKRYLVRRASRALKEGVPLNYLLLEEQVDQARIWTKVLRDA